MLEMKQIFILISLVAGLLICLAYLYGISLSVTPPMVTIPADISNRIITWNHISAHTGSPNISDLAILPSYNTSWAQVIQVGVPTAQTTSGINATYVIMNNTVSKAKTNILTYEKQLFNLADNSQILVLAPISSGLHCDNCHSDDGAATVRGGITPTGLVETNILSLHDKLSLAKYPPGHTGALLDRRPILCIECHASDALGASGAPGVPSLSKSLHMQHKNLVTFLSIHSYITTTIQDQ
jgi:hypothetical protein